MAEARETAPVDAPEEEEGAPEEEGAAGEDRVAPGPCAQQHEAEEARAGPEEEDAEPQESTDEHSEQPDALAAGPAPASRAVLRLRGVPFAATEDSVLRFFAGAEGVEPPLEVYICRRNGAHASNNGRSPS